MAIYAYEPENCMDGGVNQMRFELGDTACEMGELSAALSNEEYTAIINSTSSWKTAKLKCLKSIVMRLSYEVDTSVDGLSYALSQRAERWKAMYKDLKKELAVGVPVANPGALTPPGGEQYFYADMQTNPRKW